MMVLLLVAGPRLLPEYRDADAGRLDLPSVVLSLAAILPVIYGLKELAEDGPGLLPVAGHRRRRGRRRVLRPSAAGPRPIR